MLFSSLRDLGHQFKGYKDDRNRNYHARPYKVRAQWGQAVISQPDFCAYSGGHPLRGTILVRCAEVWERGEQVGVRPYVVSRHLSVCENGDEAIHHVI